MNKTKASGSVNASAISRIISSPWGWRLPFWAGPVSGWHSGPRSSSPPSFAASPGGRCTRDASGDASRCSWGREGEGGRFFINVSASPHWQHPYFHRLTSLSLSAATGRQYSNVQGQTHKYTQLYCKDNHNWIPVVLSVGSTTYITRSIGLQIRCFHYQ